MALVSLKNLNNLKTAANSLKKAMKPTYNDLFSTKSSGAKALKSVASSSSKSSGSSGGGSSKSYTYTAPKSGGVRSGGGGGGGGGGGVPAPVPWNPSGDAANYLQAAADMFARDPAIMLKDKLNAQYGADSLSDNQLFAQLLPMVRNANPLFMAAQGQSGATATDESWINYLGAYIDQLRTPGQFYDTAGGLRNVFGAAAGSPLEAFLTQGDAATQTANTLKLTDALLDTGYHPMAAEAIQNFMNEQAMNYMAAASRAAQDPFVSYLKAANPTLASQMFGI